MIYYKKHYLNPKLKSSTSNKKHPNDLNQLNSLFDTQEYSNSVKSKKTNKSKFDLKQKRPFSVIMKSKFNNPFSDLRSIDEENYRNAIKINDTKIMLKIKDEKFVEVNSFETLSQKFYDRKLLAQKRNLTLEYSKKVREQSKITTQSVEKIKNKEIKIENEHFPSVKKDRKTSFMTLKKKNTNIGASISENFQSKFILSSTPKYKKISSNFTVDNKNSSNIIQFDNEFSNFLINLTCEKNLNDTVEKLSCNQINNDEDYKTEISISTFYKKSVKNINKNSPKAAKIYNPIKKFENENNTINSNFLDSIDTCKDDDMQSIQSKSKDYNKHENNNIKSGRKIVNFEGLAEFYNAKPKKLSKDFYSRFVTHANSIKMKDNKALNTEYKYNDINRKSKFYNESKSKFPESNSKANKYSNKFIPQSTINKSSSLKFKNNFSKVKSCDYNEKSSINKNKISDFKLTGQKVNKHNIYNKSLSIDKLSIENNFTKEENMKNYNNTITQASKLTIVKKFPILKKHSFLNKNNKEILNKNNIIIREEWNPIKSKLNSPSSISPIENKIVNKTKLNSNKRNLLQVSQKNNTNTKLKKLNSSKLSGNLVKTQSLNECDNNSKYTRNMLTDYKEIYSASHKRIESSKDINFNPQIINVTNNFNINLNEREFYSNKHIENIDSYVSNYNLHNTKIFKSKSFNLNNSI